MTKTKKLTLNTMTDSKVILVAGPLGSGKTTILNKLYDSLPRGSTASAIINDAGIRGTDSTRFRGDSLAIPGCVCCGSLDETVSAIEARRKAGTDFLFVEPTGGANAVSLAEGIQRATPLDIIITAIPSFYENVAHTTAMQTGLVVAHVGVNTHGNPAYNSGIPPIPRIEISEVTLNRVLTEKESYKAADFVFMPVSAFGLNGEMKSKNPVMVKNNNHDSIATQYQALSRNIDEEAFLESVRERRFERAKGVLPCGRGFCAVQGRVFIDDSTYAVSPYIMIISTQGTPENTLKHYSANPDEPQLMFTPHASAESKVSAFTYTLNQAQKTRGGNATTYEAPDVALLMAMELYEGGNLAFIEPAIREYARVRFEGHSLLEAESSVINNAYLTQLLAQSNRGRGGYPRENGLFYLGDVTPFDLQPRIKEHARELTRQKTPIGEYHTFITEMKEVAHDNL
ncbi:MAG: GTP-binding protein [Candidatus Woesearchaeota archaeon]